MRPFAFAVVLAWAAASVAAEPAVTRLKLPEYEYAEWLADGSGFYVVGRESLQRFDANGRARGPSVPLPGMPGLPADAVTATPMGGHRGLSRDGKKLALLVGGEGDNPSPYVIDLVARRARKLDAGAELFAGIEWTSDGALIGVRLPSGRFRIDAAGRLTALCPQFRYPSVHVHPDGERIVIGAEQLYIVDRDCRTRDTFAPWPEGAGPATWISGTALSAAGRIALIGGRNNEPGVLWVSSSDRKKSLRTDVSPAITIAWLGEDTVVASVENGTGSSQRVLVKVDAATAKAAPLIPIAATCSDSDVSPSPRGDRLLFQRLCDDPKGSFVALVRR